MAKLPSSSMLLPQKLKNHLRRLNIWFVLLNVFLCSVSFFLGNYMNSGFSNAVRQAANVFPSPPSSSPCSSFSSSSSMTTSSSSSSAALDFYSRHSAEELIRSYAVLRWNSSSSSSSSSSDGGGGGGVWTAVKEFPACDAGLSEYTPCHDTKRSLRFPRNNLIYRERHCPEKGVDEPLKCRVPAPYGYKPTFQWPKSRDMVWYANVPHKWLTVEKAGQNWVRFEGDRFTFPGGGTMFPDGADAYINEINKLVNLRDGSVRTAIDTGCGVASWGAYLMSRDILPLSFAPKDTHDAQVQFALERGVPALIGILATERLPYPSRAFDMAHCSRCLIPWSQFDGIYLAEVDRILRPGGYWILSGPPINWQRHQKGWARTAEDLRSEQTRIEEVAKGLCWKKLKQRGDIAVWQKPTNHINCKKVKRVFKRPPFCDTIRNPDQAWYTKMETCLTPLPEVSSLTETAGGGELARWPKRLSEVPPRITSGSVEGVTAEMFEMDVEVWSKRIGYYKSVCGELGQKGRYRNLLDMNAGFGGLAASLAEGKDPVWVMNVVPVEAKVDTLGVVFERGLIGTYHSWCEAMSTYPRTYDFIHADHVFSLYAGKCEIVDILLEMDRILRPEGSVIIVDDVDVVVNIKKHTDGMKWNSRIFDHEKGPLHRLKLLVAVKQYWTAPVPPPLKQFPS